MALLKILKGICYTEDEDKCNQKNMKRISPTTHEYKRGYGRWTSERGQGVKKGYYGVKKFKIYYINIYEDTKMEPIKCCFEKWGGGGGPRGIQWSVQSIQYTSVKLSQCNSLVLLMIPKNKKE
jgi:hypothetical protein